MNLFTLLKNNLLFTGIGSLIPILSYPILKRHRYIMHQKVEGKAKFKTGKFKTFHMLAVSLWVTQISINKIIGLSFSKFLLNFSFSVLWTTSSHYLQSYMREESHRGFGATVEEQGLSGPSRHLRDVFNIWEPLWWPCVLEAKYFADERGQIYKPPTQCFLGGWTCKLLSQVCDLPQSPGWVPNYTERSLSSQRCLVDTVSRKSPEEM